MTRAVVMESRGAVRQSRGVVMESAGVEKITWYMNFS